MRAADLDDGLELDGLGVQGVAQFLHGGDERALRLQRGGDRHGAGEGVVGRLRHVHVVVGMHRLLGAELAARDFDAAIGDDLVDVHVALRAAAGLPHAQREMVVMLARDDFIRRLDDEVRHLRLELAQVLIHQRARLLQHREIMDDLERNPVRANIKMDQRASRLRAVVTVIGHSNFAHGIGFKTMASRSNSGFRSVRHRGGY